MPTTTITLQIMPVARRNIPFFLPRLKRLGDVEVFTDDFTIKNTPNLTGQHSGFCVRVRKPNWWLCRAGYILPGKPGTPFPYGGQLHARGLVDVTNQTNTVAITGGTGDYRRASGEVLTAGSTYTVTVETP